MKKLSKLKEARIAKGLSQAKLAKKLRTDQPSIHRWESGQVMPYPDTLLRIAKVLGCTPADLM